MCICARRGAHIALLITALANANLQCIAKRHYRGCEKSEFRGRRRFSLCNRLGHHPCEISCCPHERVQYEAFFCPVRCEEKLGQELTINTLARNATRQQISMTIALCTVIIYAKDMHRTARFYSENFGYETSGEVREGLIELRPTEGGTEILIHQAAKSLRLGSAAIKLSFAVTDVQQFVEAAKAKGVAFGAIHQANGYAFANAKDPDGNSISVSSRKFRD